MAKMFYTLDEAADKLGKSAHEVEEMAESGQIEQFRDRDKLMFKVEQINLLAGGAGAGEEENVDILELVDSGEQDAIELKEESVLGLADSRESTGISIFDAEELETSDPSAVTQISDSIAPAEFNLDSGASGSGLLDLTREADDTSLGADLLDEIYPGGDDGDDMGLEASGTGLFSSGTEEVGTDIGSPMVMPKAVEVYDGAWSGLGVGLAIGGVAALLLSVLVLVTSLTGTLAGIAVQIADSFPIFMGILAGLTLILGILGYFIGRATG